MEQRDYLLREIEKIGAIISRLRQLIFGGKGNPAITLEKQFEAAKEMVLGEINFDIDKFLALDVEKSNEYLSDFAGFNVANIEVLADFFLQTGLAAEGDNIRRYLEKALQLYNLCNIKSATYSLDREANMQIIKETLETI